MAQQGAESLDVTGSGWQGRGVPLASVRALASRSWLDARHRRPSGTAFEQARAEPPAGNDLLTVVRGGQGQTVPCIVDRLGADGVAVQAGGQALTVPWAAGGLAGAEPGRRRAGGPAAADMVELADGTVLRAPTLALEEAN